MTVSSTITLNKSRTSNIHTIHDQQSINKSINPSLLPGITQAQLSNHLGENFNIQSPDALVSCPSWTAIYGQVYDLSSFMSLHPGGSVIRLAAGRDATALVESYHSKDAMKRVYAALSNKCHLIGPYVEGPPKASAALAPQLPINQANNPAFFHTVQARVDDLLKSKGWDHHTFETFSMIESFVTLMLYFVMVYYSCIQGSFLAAVAVGVLTGRMGFLMHTGNHCASSSSRVGNSLIGLFMNVIGSSHLIWQHEHQVAHHLDPNELEKDNDCAIGNPFIRPSSFETW
jgi:cytochrome b involved in lipid metabolism